MRRGSEDESLCVGNPGSRKEEGRKPQEELLVYGSLMLAMVFTNVGLYETRQYTFSVSWIWSEESEDITLLYSD